MNLILSFFVYSFFGFIIETILCSISLKKICNRGFLYGPILPIYGFGGILIYIVFQYLSFSWLLVFLGSMLLASILEYFTSYFMEKIFYFRWWDYSKRKFHFHGRICLLNSILFGLLGIGVVYFLQPYLTRVFQLLNSLQKEILSIVLLIIFLLDSFFTILELFRLKRRFIIDTSPVFYSRIVVAFPKVSSKNQTEKLIKLKEYNKNKGNIQKNRRMYRNE